MGQTDKGMIAYTLDQALAWFLSNTCGYIRCVRGDGAEKDCRSYKEARAFFEYADETGQVD